MAQPARTMAAILGLWVAAYPAFIVHAEENPRFDILKYGATDEAIGKLLHSANMPDCSESYCTGLVLLENLEHVYLNRTFPNSSTLAVPSKFNPRVFDRQIDHILARTRSRHAGLCQALAVLLRHYVAPTGNWQACGSWRLPAGSIAPTAQAAWNKP